MTKKYFYGIECESTNEPNVLRTTYGQIAKLFNHVLCNDIPVLFPSMWDYIENGFQCDDEEYPEIFQYYIVDGFGAEVIRCTNDPLFYIPELSVYVWGITHYGTSWNYVDCYIDLNK